MSWIRLDDQIAHHPKVTQVSPTACWLWVTAIGHAQKFLTDGFIRSTSIRALSHVENPEAFIDELVGAGLLDIVDGGYQVHDYLDFNASASSVKAKREADRVRKEATRIPHGIQPESARNPQSVLARAPASHPIPSHPDHSKDLVNSLQGASELKIPTNGNGNGWREHFEAFWEHYPKKASKSKAELWWKRYRPDEALRARIWPALEAQANSMEWAREAGRFVPLAVRWLEQRGWEDELTPRDSDRRALIKPIGGSSCPHKPTCRSNTACIALCIDEGRRERAAR